MHSVDNIQGEVLDPLLWFALYMVLRYRSVLCKQELLIGCVYCYIAYSPSYKGSYLIPFAR
jgi:hypothetical protein